MRASNRRQLFLQRVHQLLGFRFSEHVVVNEGFKWPNHREAKIALFTLSAKTRCQADGRIRVTKLILVHTKHTGQAFDKPGVYVMRRVKSRSPKNIQGPFIRDRVGCVTCKVRLNGVQITAKSGFKLPSIPPHGYLGHSGGFRKAGALVWWSLARTLTDRRAPGSSFSGPRVEEEYRGYPSADVGHLVNYRAN